MGRLPACPEELRQLLGVGWILSALPGRVGEKEQRSLSYQPFSFQAPVRIPATRGDRQGCWRVLGARAAKICAGC